MYWQDINLGCWGDGSATPFINRIGLKAAVQGVFNGTRIDVICHIHSGFVFGCDDIFQLANQINGSYGQSHHTGMSVKLCLKDHSAPTKSSSESLWDFTNLTDSHLVINSLDIALDFDENAHGATWEAICRDSLRILYPSLLQRPLHRSKRPDINLRNITMENAAAYINQVCPDHALSSCSSD
jgi:hypothetical protein